MTSSNSFPPAGVYSLKVLPEPYQTAFRQGSAHHLPGQFIPAKTDCFLQVLLLPFTLIYASPILSLGPFMLYQAIRKPSRYLRFWQTLTRLDLPELGMALLLLLLAAILLGYCTSQAWDQAQSFYRTWHCAQRRQQSEEGYGVVLLSHAIVGRLIDNLGQYNCLWLPQEALTNIVWQRMREEGAKRARWVDRTRICYVSAPGKHHWLTLKGDVVDFGHPAHESNSDRMLYETLMDWWQEQPLDERPS